jgi:hypothetical protein
LTVLEGDRLVFSFVLIFLFFIALVPVFSTFIVVFLNRSKLTATIAVRPRDIFTTFVLLTQYATLSEGSTGCSLGAPNTSASNITPGGVGRGILYEDGRWGLSR